MGNALSTSNKTKQGGRMVVGGLVAASLVAGGIWLNSLSTDGSIQKNDEFAAFLPVVIDISATGSTSATRKYDAYCGDSPISVAGMGSGTVVRAHYHNIANPAGASLDIGYVDSCNSKSASGAEIIDNACTGTGCDSYYTTGTSVFNGGKKLKVTISKDPTASFDAKLTLWMEDNLGE